MSARDLLLRRALLTRAASLGAAISVVGMGAGCGDDSSGEGGGGGGEEEVESPVFVHGVASGDPRGDSVILWTRATVEGGAPVDVEWVVATDPDLEDEVQRGVFTTSADRDFTVKVDVGGLSPATTYYYRFHVGEERSVRGRTRTAPVGATPRLRFAMVSCASYGHGYFHVYRAVAAQADLDAVIHLGDYIYEYGDGEYGDVRTYDPPHEIVTLEDYRRRYAHYRKDADLKEVHRQHPFIVVWDDHELANNAWSGGAENHDEATEGAWSERTAVAARVYAEWMPIREQDEATRIWRSFVYGDLVELVMLDTRLWGRSEQVVDNDDLTLEDEERTLLGDEQEAFLAERLTSSTATWKVVGQQVMMGVLPQFLNVDAWDGYPAARRRFFDLVEATGAGDVVVLTGDIHTSWAMDLPRDPDDPSYDPTTGAGSLAVEFVCPGVSSPGLGLAIGDALEIENPWMKLVDTSLRGFVILDVTPERVQAAYTLFDMIEVEEGVTSSMAGAMATYRDAPHVIDDGAAAEPREDAPALAPGPGLVVA